VPTLAKAGVFPGKNKALVERLSQMVQGSKIGVVTIVLLRLQAVKGVLEVVAPLCVQAIPPLCVALPLESHSNRLRDEVHPPAMLASEVVDDRAQQCEKRLSIAIHDSVDGVKPQAINMEIVQPIDCIFNEEANNVITLGAVEVDSLAPGVW